MRPPYSPGPHDGEVPEHDIALGISSYEAFVMSNEGGCMHLGFMAAQDCFGGWWRISHFCLQSSSWPDPKKCGFWCSVGMLCMH